MTELSFFKRVHALLDQLDEDWEYGEDIGIEAAELKELCQQFIDERSNDVREAEKETSG